MKRLMIGLSVLLVVASVFVVDSAESADSSKPKLNLKASPTKCKVNTSVKFTVTVKSSKPAYEVRIYKYASGSWRKVATASQVAAGRYTAFAKASPQGAVKFKAGYVNSKGSVTAYSNPVTITVTK